MNSFALNKFEVMNEDEMESINGGSWGFVGVIAIRVGIVAGVIVASPALASAAAGFAAGVTVGTVAYGIYKYVLN